MLKTKMLTDSPVVLLHIYIAFWHILDSMHIEESSASCFVWLLWSVMTFLFAVWEGGNRPSLLFLLQFSQSANGGAAGPPYFPFCDAKVQGVHLSGALITFTAKKKEETMPFNTVTRDTSWSLLKVRGRASVPQVLTHRCPTRLPLLLSLRRQC